MSWRVTCVRWRASEDTEQRWRAEQTFVLTSRRAALHAASRIPAGRRVLPSPLPLLSAPHTQVFCTPFISKCALYDACLIAPCVLMIFFCIFLCFCISCVLRGLLTDSFSGSQIIIKIIFWIVKLLGFASNLRAKPTEVVDHTVINTAVQPVLLKPYRRSLRRLLEDHHHHHQLFRCIMAREQKSAVILRNSVNVFFLQRRNFCLTRLLGVTEVTELCWAYR